MKNYIFFPTGVQNYLFDLVHRSQVQDDVANTLFLLVGKFKSETLKLDGSSL